jgi:hypothetical protein
MVAVPALGLVLALAGLRLDSRRLAGRPSAA